MQGQGMNARAGENSGIRVHDVKSTNISKKVFCFFFNHKFPDLLGIEVHA